MVRSSIIWLSQLVAQSVGASARACVAFNVTGSSPGVLIIFISTIYIVL